MQRHRGFRFLALASVAVAPATARAQQSVVRSDDGRAVLTLGAPAAGAPVRVVRLADGDDVAGVTGSHYRIEGSVQSLPRNSVLAIRWDSAGLPGGVSPASVTLMHRTGDAWEATGARVDPEHSLVTSVATPGDFAVRWSPVRRCEGDRALDFRIGTWDYRAPGYTPGKSVVTRDASQCALFDHYVDLQGARSTSFFYFDAGSATWYNTTIDPGGRFVSRGELLADGIAFYHSPVDREVYRRRPDGTIAFAAERSTDNGHTWTAWATATYTPVR